MPLNISVGSCTWRILEKDICGESSRKWECRREAGRPGLANRFATRDHLRIRHMTTPAATERSGWRDPSAHAGRVWLSAPQNVVLSASRAATLRQYRFRPERAATASGLARRMLQIGDGCSDTERVCWSPRVAITMSCEPGLGQTAHALRHAALLGSSMRRSRPGVPMCVASQST